MYKIRTVIVELGYPIDSDDDYLVNEIADEYYGVARELIRCKDCKKYNPNAGDNEVTGHCNMLGSYRVPRDGYCAWAERRTE